MDDLISRQAAIDIVYRQRFGMQKMAFDIIMEKLSELPSAQSEPKWIPVTELLPEEDKYVLVSTEDNDIDIARYDYNEWVDDPEIEWWNGEYRVFPTAWMPLPEPYRKEAENADANGG